MRSVALTLSLSQRHFPPNGFLQIVIETSDTPVNGRGVSGRTSPGRERVVELFFARRTRSARAKWRDEWRDQNLDERRASHTWSNLKSYQSHLCQFSCLVVSPCSRRPSGPPSRPLSPSLSLSLFLSSFLPLPFRVRKAEAQTARARVIGEPASTPRCRRHVFEAFS